MENELPEEGVRPPAYREAGCSKQSIWASCRRNAASLARVFGRGQEPPGEGEGSRGLGRIRGLALTHNYTTSSSCGLWG